MGQKGAVFQAGQLGMDPGFKFVHIKPCGMNNPFLEGMGQGLFVMNRPAGRIDENGAPFHFKEFPCPKAVAGLGG